MNDLAFGLLRDELNKRSDRESIWVVDENIAATQISQINPVPSLTAVTNRYDIHLQLKASGFNALLNDFDFSFAQGAQNLFYRVSKEKAVVHHIINSAAKRLDDDGNLFLSGCKNEGIKTYVKKTSEMFGAPIEQKKDAKSSLLVCFRKSAQIDTFLDDKSYCEFVEVPQSGAGTLISKPGVFGWSKIDKGSEFLADNLANFFGGLSEPVSAIADLGCGYGYISLMASNISNAKIIAVDNNVAAVMSCEKNFQQSAVNGRVVLDDCGNSIEDKVDVVLCNPPFHQGFDVEGDLTLHFLRAAKRLLTGKGCAFFVVNSFIPLEKKARAYFSKVEMLDNNGSFKLMILRP